MAVDIEAWVLLSIGVSFVFLRIYARCHHVGLRNLEADDYFMLLFVVAFTADVALAYTVGAYFHGLTNSYMTDEQRAALSPSSTEYFDRQSGSKIQVAGWSLYVLDLWAVKASFAVFFSRLTLGLHGMRIRIYIAYGLIAGTYLFVALGLLLSCQPMPRFWQINPDPGPLCQPTDSPFYVLSCLIADIVTDLYLVSIPLPMLWKASIPLRKKLFLIPLFSGSLVVVAAALVRGISILTAGEEGAITGSQWAVRESFVAAIVGNLPACQPLFRSWASRVGMSGLFSRSHGTTGAEGRSHRLTSMDRSRKGGKNNTNVSHTATAWASEDNFALNYTDGSMKSGSQPPTDLSGIAVTREFVVHSQEQQRV